jgi:hypothetical protein
MASDFGKPSWQLDDAAAIGAANPFTFYKPSSEAIALLRAGNLVKLIFAFESNDPQAPRAERMWVRIERIEADRYVGTLDNDPRYIEDLKCGDEVKFEARHVIQTDIGDPVPDPTSPIGEGVSSRTACSTRALEWAICTGNRRIRRTIRDGA